jgi:hypothetical protein
MLETRRIRESAPIRKSMSMSKEDALRAEELEHIFIAKFPDECPFSFSKTISKALEIAYFAMKGTDDPLPSVVPNLPESQMTLCLDTPRVSRSSIQTESGHDVKGSASISPKPLIKSGHNPNKPSKLSRKFKPR